MLLVLAELVENRDHTIRLGRIIGADATTAMRFNGLEQVGRSAVVEEEYPLPKPPQRCTAKLARSRLTLTDAVSQSRSHVMNQQVGIKIHRSIAQRRDGGVASVEGWRMA